MIRSNNSSSGYIYKGIKTKNLDRQLYTNVHRNIIHNSKKKMGNSNVEQKKNKWINKMCCIHSMEYQSALTKNKCLTYATMWINSEDIMVNKISEIQEDSYYMI